MFHPLPASETKMWDSKLPIPKEIDFLIMAKSNVCKLNKTLLNKEEPASAANGQKMKNKLNSGSEDKIVLGFPYICQILLL